MFEADLSMEYVLEANMLSTPGQCASAFHVTVPVFVSAALAQEETVYEFVPTLPLLTHQ
jgi:hypothetical protein